MIDDAQLLRGSVSGRRRPAEGRRKDARKWTSLKPGDARATTRSLCVRLDAAYAVVSRFVLPAVERDPQQRGPAVEIAKTVHEGR